MALKSQVTCLFWIYFLFEPDTCDALHAPNAPKAPAAPAALFAPDATNSL